MIKILMIAVLQTQAYTINFPKVKMKPCEDKDTKLI